MREIYYAEVNMTCIIIMMMILIATLSIKNNLRMRAYRGMVISDIAFSLCDMIAGLARGKFFFADRFVLWASNIGYFIASFSIATFWIVLCMYLLYGRVNFKILIPVYIIVAIVSLVYISSIFNGLCFTIDEKNLYSRGPLVWLQWAVMIPCVGVPSCIAAFSKTQATKQERIVIWTFSLFPLIAMLIQIYSYGITVCQVGITCSNILIYIFIQSQSVNEEKSRAKLISEISNLDVLTGLNNRLLYECRLDELKKEEWVGVLFADLNGLKTMNDSQGHVAGDQMIMNFAFQLMSYFPGNELFRISGDEFVVLTLDKDAFDGASGKLMNVVGDSASIGKYEGNGADIINIVAEAEKDMYEKKSDYYQRTGKDRRK